MAALAYRGSTGIVCVLVTNTWRLEGSPVKLEMEMEMELPGLFCRRTFRGNACHGTSVAHRHAERSDVRSVQPAAATSWSACVTSVSSGASNTRRTW